MPFDPDATGVIPKLTFDEEPSGPVPEASGEEPADVPDGAPADDAGDDRAADQTTTFRIPGPVHIGHPPTAEEAADPAVAGTVSMPVQRPEDDPGAAPKVSGPSGPDADAERPREARAASEAAATNPALRRPPGGAARGDAPSAATTTRPAPKPPTRKTGGSKASPSKGEASKTETPRTEAPQGEAPKTEARKGEAPKTEVSGAEASRAGAPTTAAPTAAASTGEGVTAKGATAAVSEAEEATAQESKGEAPAAASGASSSPTAAETTRAVPKPPVRLGKAPVGGGKAPGSGTKPSADATKPPTDAPEPPADAPEPPSNATKTSADGTGAPAGDDVKTPAGGAGQPADAGSAPAEGGKTAVGGSSTAAAAEQDRPASERPADETTAPGKTSAAAKSGSAPGAAAGAASASQTPGSQTSAAAPAAPVAPTPAKAPSAPGTPAPEKSPAARATPAAPVAPAPAPSVPVAPGAPGGAATASGTASGAVPAEAPTRVPTPAPARPQGGKAGRLAALLASAPKWLPVVLVLEGLVMYVLALKAPPGPLRGVDPAAIDGLGLISALPATAFLAIIIMLVSFFVTVAQSTDRKFLLLFQIAAITFALHGAGALVAAEPRFPTAYIHAGFVEFISRTGESAISIDARMGWPGFFALFAFVTKAAGIHDMTTILQWTPLLSNLLYLLPFVLILRQVVATTRARWFAALLFVLVQWIGQDYFSPQGFTFALYLAWVAILLRWFGRVEPRTEPVAPKGLRKLLGRLDAMMPGELANTGTYRADKLLMLLMLIALFLAAVASHQITPFMMLGVLTAFLIFKRTSLTWALPFFLGLAVLAWISYMTVGFWSSQIDAIFGGLGNILQNLRSNTGDRIEGSDPAHALVLQARLGILVVILSLAATGLLRRLRRGVFDRSALILLCVPVLALGLQSYGGEIGLRIYMFALPGACLLAAYAFFPNLPADSADVREETVPLRKRNVRFDPRLTKKLSVVLAACFAVLFAFAFLLARYGNEKFERVTTGEVAAMHYVYEHDKPSARVLYLVPKVGNEVTPTMPWGERDIEIVNFNVQALVHKDPTIIADAVKTLQEQPRNSYLMVSRGQVSYLQLNEGYPADWGERFRAALDASPDLKRVYANDDAALYTWKKFVRGTETPEPRPYKSARGEPTSPWTPVGIAALGVTWVTLLTYEIIRLNGPNRARRTRKRLLYLAVPAFAVAFAVIIERFIYIAQNN
ncbi:hypothetical protein MF672_001670 [Actinomadura sp. ATCC 31491]|uniref:Uncharacterized protein n=1 Tax=Actinomadura luzonensis TaxID=2805427 RepID=A0ABT0FJN0_9ACTN|nr:hypothetical protein [Actinomadura luzonensis]MCK2212514.1 hypothetical protein [Actinomadura luzonensis]